jgi:hypothetical protein
MTRQPKRTIPAANGIKLFFHCGRCLADRPYNMSPSEWSQIEAGWTTLGLQVRCKRCDLNIIHVDFEGHKHPANVSGTGDATH